MAPRNCASTTRRASGGMTLEHGIGRPVDQRIAVAHGDGEGDANADVGGGARDFAGLLDERRRAMRAHVMGHDRSRARARGASESGERGQVGIDRGIAARRSSQVSNGLPAPPNDVGERAAHDRAR